MFTLEAGRLPVPVPEEQPLRGVPLEKHHRSGFSAARASHAEDRKTEGEEAPARKREWQCLSLITSIYTGPFTSSSAFPPERLVSSVWPASSRQMWKGGF